MGTGSSDKPEIVALSKADAVAPQDLAAKRAKLKRASKAPGADALRRQRRRHA